MERIVKTRKLEDVPRSRRRRGLRGQRRRRRREREVKEAAVAYSRWVRGCGHGHDEAARHLGLCNKTLRRWEHDWHGGRLSIRVRGRPVRVVDDGLRQEVFSTLRELGPGTGVPKLRELFPGVGRRELEELVRRYRHAFHRDRRLWIYALRWTRPGSVWAADFSEPPCPIDGVYDQLLCVQDLPSESLLWSLPTIGKDGATVAQSLEALVKWYGAPLVLKVDNDSVFRCEAVRAWAERHGVWLLYSPAYRPSYNGSVECGIGGLKTRAHYASALRDRVGEWTCDDVELARCQMNALGRPRGNAGPSPDRLWHERTPITDGERSRFQEVYGRLQAQEQARRGIPSGVDLQHRERSSIDRYAIAGALLATGFLLMRRRRITLPLRRWKKDEIW